MKLGLINSVWEQAGRPTDYGIIKTRELGFDTIDIFTDPLEINVEEKEQIIRTCDQEGLPIVSLACVAVGLVDFNRSVRQFHLDRVKAFLELASEFRADNVLLVMGEYIWNQEVIPPEEQWRMGVESCRELGSRAMDLGLQIALEIEPFAMSLLRDVDSMVRFIDEVKSPAVKANIDISHLHLAGVAPQDLRRLKGKAIHVHISDCDGKVHGDLPPGRGVVNFMPYLREIKALGISGTISVELEYAPDPETIEQWIAEAYYETNVMMQQLQLRDGKN